MSRQRAKQEPLAGLISTNFPLIIYNRGVTLRC